MSADIAQAGGFPSTPAGVATATNAVKTLSGEALPRLAENRSVIESLRVLLAIIAVLLILNGRAAATLPQMLAVIAFSGYAVGLLWLTANGSPIAERRTYCWLDALWLIALLALGGESRSTLFPLLFFPVFFAAWRTGYREGVVLAAFSCLASLLVFTLSEPEITWMRLLVPHLALFLIVPLLLAVARGGLPPGAAQAQAGAIVDGMDPRRGFDTIISGLIKRIALHMGGSVAILAMRTFDGRSRVICWEAVEGSSELSETASFPIVEQALSLAGEFSFGFAGARHWWQQDRQICLARSGASCSLRRADHNTLLSLSSIIGQMRLLCVPLSCPGIGHMRLIISGESIKIGDRTLDLLRHIVQQIGPTVENSYLRERLVTEAADTERARIGRDLHDSAIQPYIGLKFALEAVHRQAGPDNPIAPDLANLVNMVTEELGAMREIISGLRGTPGKGGALLSNAVRRQATRFGQLFGIEVEVEVEGEMPVSRRIAGELFHIVAEGLSNIRRHTQARRAWISLSSAGQLLVLRIRNINDAGTPAVPNFTPASLTERASGLGGTVRVDRDKSSTTVTVSVPIPASKTKERPC